MQTQELINISESLNKPSFSLSEIILIVRDRCADKSFLEEPRFTVEFASEHMIYDHAIRCIHGGSLIATNEMAMNKGGQVFARHMVKPDDFLLWAMREQNKLGLKIIDEDVGRVLIELLDDKELKGIPNMIAREILQNDGNIKSMMVKFKSDRSSPLNGRLISQAIRERPNLDGPKQSYMKKGRGKGKDREETFFRAVKNALKKIANSKEFDDLLAFQPN